MAFINESQKAQVDDQLIPRERESFFNVLKLSNYEGFWYIPEQIENIKKFQSQYEAFDDDIILASPLKTGTAWCKALIASIMRPGDEDMLAQKMVHAHVPNLENAVYGSKLRVDPSLLPPPRLFHTHVPYTSLPDSVKSKHCKIVYVARNPKDTLISLWYFMNEILKPIQEPYPLEKAFESFCNGVLPYGPFFEHIVEYWNESLKTPQKILFLKFEDLKKDPRTQVKKLASFLGRPIDDEKEIDGILSRCSFERLKGLEVNQNGGGEWANGVTVPFSAFFRKGNVGDWKNHFTAEMGERLEQIAKEKLESSGLQLDV